MRKRSGKVTYLDTRRDVNEIASAIVNRTIELADAGDLETPKKKNPAAVALGRRGGLKGGKARAAKLTPEERRASAVKAARARWENHKN
jgi:hypothetical protein